MNTALFVIVPPNLSIDAVNEPDVISTAFAIEPSVTVTSPVSISVVPAPVIAFANVPPVNVTFPLVTSKPVPIPSAFVVNVPDNRFICWLIILPSVKDTSPVVIVVLPVPVIFEFIVPACTSRPSAILFVTTPVVVMPFVAINLPPVIVTAACVIAPLVVVPPLIVVEPLAFVISSNPFVPLNVKLPAFATLAPVTF